MKYLLNNQIIFNSDTGTVDLAVNGGDPVQLSNPAKRLLLLLIYHKGETVSRDVIFKKVWDDFGMISSNNNLNQCISKLRRVLKTRGMEDEVIATVPKLGFMWREGIDIRELPDEATSSELQRPTSPEVEAQSDNVSKPSSAIRINTMITPSPAHHRMPPSLRNAWLLLLISIIILGLSAGFWWDGTKANRTEAFVGTVGTCRVLLSQNVVSDRGETALQSGLLDYAKKLNPQCSSDEYLLVIKGDAIKSWTHDLTRLHFMRCGSLRESKAEVCWSLAEPRPDITQK